MPVIVQIAVPVGVVIVALVAHALGYAFLRRLAVGRGEVLVGSIVRRTRRPSGVVVAFAVAEVAVASVRMRPRIGSDVVHGVGIVLILAAAWLAVRLTYVFEDVVLERFQLGGPENLRARQVHTQIQILRRVTVMAVAVIALAIVLLSFSAVRTAGAGLLASAGLVGLLAGVAARPAATNLVAGIQLAITQPIRVDDVVVVDGYWGRVEDITLTFVTVRVWDLRRLILPVSYFIQNPFESWTRRTADILGVVTVDVDYTVPVDAVRRRIGEILEASPDWDKKVWNLQVTNLGVSTVQLRALMSAADSSASWNLQCEVREKLLAFLQERYPSAMPRLRAEIGPAGEADGKATGSAGRVVPGAEG